MNSVDKMFYCILPSGMLTYPYFEYENTLFGSQGKSTNNVTEENCDDAKLTAKLAIDMLAAEFSVTRVQCCLVALALLFITS